MKLHVMNIIIELVKNYYNYNLIINNNEINV